MGEIRNMVRLLQADEIECRVSVISEKGLSLLLYKDARVDQKILDETFGVFGWKRSHQCCDTRPGDRGMDCKAGCRDNGLYGERKITGVGQL